MALAGLIISSLEGQRRTPWCDLNRYEQQWDAIGLSQFRGPGFRLAFKLLKLYEGSVFRSPQFEVRLLIFLPLETLNNFLPNLYNIQKNQNPFMVSLLPTLNG